MKIVAIIIMMLWGVVMIITYPFVWIRELATAGLSWVVRETFYGHPTD